MAEAYISGEKHKKMMASQPGNTMTTYKPFIMVAVALVVIGLSFFGGVQYQKGRQPAASTSTTAAGGTGTGPGGGGFGAGGGRGGRRGAFGQVTAISPTSITIKSQAGTSSTLTITSSTTITDNGQTDTTSDIQVGDTVIAMPDPTNAGQAARILVNPSFGGGGGQQGTSGSTPSANTQD